MTTRENLQALVPSDHAARVRATVAGMQRLRGASYTLTRFITEATEAYCRRLEDDYNGGRPWPRVGPLTRGARVRDPQASDDEGDLP